MAHKILVTGSTGTVGKPIVKALQQRKASFVAAARDPEKAKGILGTDTPLVQFDFSDPSTYKQAVDGVDKIFVLGPPMVLELDKLIIPFIDFLKSNGHYHVVYMGALGLEHVKELPFHDRIIQHIASNGFDLTVLKPSFFAQNFKNYEWDNITQRGVVYVPASTGKVSTIDANDIAAVAAAALTEEGHIGKTYELTGPELFTYHDIAALLTEITGKTIVYPAPSPQEFAATLEAAGAPAFIASYMNNVYKLISDNFVGYISNDVEKVTGKKPTPLREVLQRDFAAVVA
ncbi:MAG: SDR family oxidoreductase [Chitinophagaceae bacterium]|nr:SDR family oxidoreductase [Chitinophagaceae bacterium]